MIRALRLLLLGGILVFIYFPGLPLISYLAPHPAAAVSFTLFGRINPLSTAGWGSTSSTTKSPGPTLVVTPGASVTMSLFSADAIGHTFCVDYESVPNFICDANEPLSPLFSSSTVPVTFTFTATSVPGNYTYYCTIHGSPMVGSFIVSNPATYSFTLYGRINPLASAGWGTSAGTTKSPGPTLSVTPGSSVTLTLFSADGIGHTFCVDYEQVPNFGCEANEPLSPLFSSSTIPLMFTFTATFTPGNYTYYCTIHGSPMVGTFQVTPHDVAVTGISTSRNFAYNSVSANPVQVNVTAANVGTSTDTFFVSAKGNSTLIGNQSITLAPGQTAIVPFLWSTSSLLRGNYNLTALATRVPGEGNTSNNLLIGAIFTVKFKGDVTGDCMVTINDVLAVQGRFQAMMGQANYLAIADLNNDGVINILDVLVVNGAFGTHC